MEWLTPTTLEPIQQAATDPAFTPTNPSSLTLAILGVILLAMFRWLRVAKTEETPATYHLRPTEKAGSLQNGSRRRVA